MSNSLVNSRSASYAGYCCRDCYPEYGSSPKRKEKNRFKRMLRSREKQNFLKSLRSGDY